MRIGCHLPGLHGDLRVQVVPWPLDRRVDGKRPDIRQAGDAGQEAASVLVHFHPRLDLPGFERSTQIICAATADPLGGQAGLEVIGPDALTRCVHF